MPTVSFGRAWRVGGISFIAAGLAVFAAACGAGAGSGTGGGAGANPASASAVAARAITAYVVSYWGSGLKNEGHRTVTPVDLATGRAAAPISFGRPSDISTLFPALTPNRGTLYVGDYPGTVTPVNASTDKVGRAITVGSGNLGPIAITPNGKTAYVTDPQSSAVIPITLADGVLGKPINVGHNFSLVDIAITPNGKTAYVLSLVSGTVDNTYTAMVTPINTATNTAGTSIKIGSGYSAATVYSHLIAVTPNGQTVYVLNPPPNEPPGLDGSVTPISTATDTPGRAIKVGNDPIDIAIDPNGQTVYVLNAALGSLIPISTASNTTGPVIKVAETADSMAISPNGRTVYVADYGYYGNYGTYLAGSGSVVVPVSTATNSAGPAIKLPNGSTSIGLTPDGKTLYVAGGYGVAGPGTLTPVSTATDRAGTPIKIVTGPLLLVI